VCVLLGEAREHPTDGGEIHAGPVDTADEQGDEGVPLGRHALRLRERLPDEPTSPECQTAGDAGVVGNGLAYSIDDEADVSGVLEHFHDEGTRVGVDIRCDLAVEVRRDPVTDVGLHQPLQPVGRRGVPVELVERCAERFHRRHGFDSEVLKPVAEALEVVELGHGECTESRLVTERRRHRRVVGKPLEPGEFAVREDAQQIDHRRPVDRVLVCRHPSTRPCSPSWRVPAVGLAVVRAHGARA
jgi:hypothetical protein